MIRYQETVIPTSNTHSARSGYIREAMAIQMIV